ncbi:glutathione S-transferase family protein [Rhodobacterales bacterium]|nr:glutathione S-transferase family protein [Rhodobacterales bacterium]
MTSAVDHEIVGHRLCPYVQRVVIAMREHGLPFKRRDIDLDERPNWLFDISPTGKVPLLRVPGGTWLFDSAVICRYLDTVSGGELLASDPLERARQEAWMSFADDMLATVAKMIYRDADAVALAASMEDLAGSLQSVGYRFPPMPWFAGQEFGLADAVFATLFRYFPVLDAGENRLIADALPASLCDWWQMARRRASVSSAVPASYDAELRQFIREKESHLGRVLADGHGRLTG